MGKKLPHLNHEELINLSEKIRALDATFELFEIILSSLEFEEMAQKIADAIPKKLGYETGVLALIDDKGEKLERVAISKTSGGKAARKTLEVPFENISIPMNYSKNICIRTLKEKRQLISRDLYDLLKPAISKENAEKVQIEMGTRISVVNPLYAHKNQIGVLIVSMSKDQKEISDFEKQMIKRFSKGVGIAIENSKLFTDLKRTQENLSTAYKDLKALDKAKDEFLSVASHELRTPMTIIKSYLWMLTTGKGGALTDKQKYYIDKAVTGTERLIALVNDMLNISRIEQNRIQIELEKVNVMEFLWSSYNELKIKTDEKGIYFKLEADNQNYFVNADRNRLTEIFINLIGNAIKFTDTGGITLKTEKENNFLKVSISDTGKGIDPKDINRLFHKFGRLDNSYRTVAEAGGTGLGLYISKSLVELMGGQIGVSSEGKDKGTTFWFTLPLAKNTGNENITTITENALTPEQKQVLNEHINSIV